MDAPSRDGWALSNTAARYLASFGERYLDVSRSVFAASTTNSTRSQQCLAAADDPSHGGKLRDFQGLDHRSQTVAVIDGVTTSTTRATNLGACVAPEDWATRIVLIAGGDARMRTFRRCAGRYQYVRHVVTLGRMRRRSAVSGVVPDHRVATLPERFARVGRSREARSGVVVSGVRQPRHVQELRGAWKEFAAAVLELDDASVGLLAADVVARRGDGRLRHGYPHVRWA
jgi:hypothetical protein